MTEETVAVPNPDHPEPTPARKLLFALLVGALLAIPLFATYLLVYDRQEQSATARASIAEGWGGPQTLAGPVLVIPWLDQATETVTQNGQQVVRTNPIWRSLTLAPERADIRTTVNPKRRTRSIYEAVLFEASTQGVARFALPTDLARYGVPADKLALDRAEVRFGLRDARGLFGAPPSASVNGQALVLKPGKGMDSTGGSGFFAPFDAAAIRSEPLTVRYALAFRGNGWLALAPKAGDTRWQVSSTWPDPSFQGGFLPTAPRIDSHGFAADWRIGNLALGEALVSIDGAEAKPAVDLGSRFAVTQPAGDYDARIAFVSPVDLYSQVNRSVKYGFLFIGFTFVTFLMFDVIGGVRVSAVEYLLAGAGLVLFFVMLLAFAEVIGFAAAYVVASGAIIGLLTTYSAAVLRSWHRAAYVAGLLVALYAVLYVLLSLEAYSLLIGSLLLFAALALVMWLTRGVDWGGPRRAAA